MPTTLCFHTTVPSDGTITLPLEFRGAPVQIVIAKEQANPKNSTMREFVEKFSGILKDCNIESTESMKAERINDMIVRHQ
jgi:bifunctional DNA-binding transcriptional regulator/antitoxin component of YhaV-PrlF toxin-antitoxin module